MRPLELRIRGFTCFADTVDIDFRPMDVFVICGPTGAGKSTIIDAICYALYGKVPRGTDSRALVSRNRDAMSVDLVFEVGDCDYRVHRGINLTRKTKRDGREAVTPDVSPVQLERKVGDAWEPLHDRVADINKAIEGIIGLDFTSFTRCVLLPQGRFQEFLAGDASERRNVLIDLLDLGIYQQIMTAANARAATRKTEGDAYERQLREDFAAATEEALAATRADIAAAEPDLEYARMELDALAEARLSAEAARNAIRRKAQKREQLEKQLNAVAEAGALARDGASQLAELRTACAETERELAGAGYDRDVHAALTLALREARRVASLAAEAEAAKVHAADASPLEAARAAHASADAAAAEARAAVEAAEATLEAARRADMASEVLAGLKPGDACPVCGGTVSKVAKRAKNAADPARKALAGAQKVERDAAAAATKAAQTLTRETTRQEHAVAEAARCAAELTQATAELQRALPKSVAADLPAISMRHAEQEAAGKLRDALEAKLAEEKSQLSTLEQLVAQNAEAIAKLRGDAERLDEEAKEAEGEAAESIKTLQGLAAEQKWDNVAALIADKKDPSAELAVMASAAAQRVETLTATIARLEIAAERIAAAIARAAELRATLAEIRASEKLCRELGTLLRANNFQEFVLDEAMTVLAESATHHLASLYERFSIVVKKGEFLVCDAWQAGQERSARTLSGGETFVASLALALALAERLPGLQSRTAASLDSLFLDEGFGTLDAETLDTVMGALEGLRAEERMVGIITHVGELVERMQTRIDVRKSQSGSTVVVTGGAAG